MWGRHSYSHFRNGDTEAVIRLSSVEESGHRLSVVTSDHVLALTLCSEDWVMFRAACLSACPSVHLSILCHFLILCAWTECPQGEFVEFCSEGQVLPCQQSCSSPWASPQVPRFCTLPKHIDAADASSRITLKNARDCISMAPIIH